MIRANLKTGGVEPIYVGAMADIINRNQTLTAIVANSAVSSSSSGTTITGITGTHRLVVEFSNPATSNGTTVTMSLNGTQLFNKTVSPNGGSGYFIVQETYDDEITLTGNDTITFTATSSGNGSVMRFTLY